MNTSLRLSWVLAPLVLSLACAGSKSPPPSADGAPELATVEAAPEVADGTCAASYVVKAAISGTDLSESINGNTFTDANPFVCQLATSTSTVSFGFEVTVTSDDCTYDLSYVIEGPTTSCSNPTGTPFSGSQTLNCALAELDFLSLATPQTGDRGCTGKTTLCEDPKIALNKDNCGQDQEDG
jgi:hypothetical protein